MCQLTVHAPEGTWQGQVSSWTSWQMLASLSAEPETLAELADALRRYQPDHCLLEPARMATPADAADRPWCLVDLPGRAVVGGNDFELPEPRGAYEADSTDDVEGYAIVWLDTPSDWLFREAGEDWRAVVADRAAARARQTHLDARPVLFGVPLLDHLAQGVLGALKDCNDAMIAGVVASLHVVALLQPLHCNAGQSGWRAMTQRCNDGLLTN